MSMRLVTYEGKKVDILTKIASDVYWGLSKVEFYLIIQKVLDIVSINDDYYKETGYLHSESMGEGLELLKLILSQQAPRTGKSCRHPNVERRDYRYSPYSQRARDLHHQDITRQDFNQWVGVMRRSVKLAHGLDAAKQAIGQ